MGKRKKKKEKIASAGYFAKLLWWPTSRLHDQIKRKGKSALHLELSQKFDFQPLTTKSDNNVYLTVETLQIWLFLGGFEGGFLFYEN